MTNETKQTAVEQLFIEMLEIQQSGKTLTFDENVELLNKYKEMEKEQMIEFAKEVFIYRYYGIQERLSDIANDIYNETYGGNKWHKKQNKWQLSGCIKKC